MDPRPDIVIIGSRLLSRYPQLRSGMSTRGGGVSPEPLGMNLSYKVGDEAGRVDMNRELFFGRLGIRVPDLAIPGQVHGDAIAVVRGSGNYPATDGLMSGNPGVFLVVTVADCLPVFLFDPRTRTVAMVHAGWRGSGSGIVEKAVRLMTSQRGVRPGDLIAFLGPCAGVCCYGVRDDVAGQFPRRHIREKDGKLFLDLREINHEMLLGAGVPGTSIELSDQCTICGPRLFHSYRRDRERSGRMMAVIGLEPPLR